jgi:hypothetical protein
MLCYKLLRWYKQRLAAFAFLISPGMAVGAARGMMRASLKRVFEIQGVQ